MKEYKYNYEYHQFKNENGGITIVAVSSYAGRKVKGYAKCNPDDEFDLEKGKALARARCNQKIANKRRNHAAKKYMEAVSAKYKAVREFERMKQYYIDSVDKLDVATDELVKICSECN